MTPVLQTIHKAPALIAGGPIPALLHDDIEPHTHLTDEELKAISDAVWRVDNVEFTTVGIDIGSSTSHLMFSRVHLRRQKDNLSSRFIVVDRRILWSSPIVFTPFVDDDTIDTAQLGAFIGDAYRQAGLAPEHVDTGAVILTGEAVKRKNAQAISAIFADEAGKFVCATAGHRLESALAAHGSGAAALSLATNRTVLNVDIGGGTTKLALCAQGQVVSVCAFAVGSRLIVRSADDRLIRLDEPALMVANAANVQLSVGQVVPAAALAPVVEKLAKVVIGYMRGDPPQDLARDLLLTEPLEGPRPELLTFSGGVAEYIYGREHKDFGDIALPLVAHIRAAMDDIGLAVHDPGQGIRATAIGASQFTVQVSGKTIYLGEVELPLYNVPVIAPEIPVGETIDPAGVAEAVCFARGRADLDCRAPIAVALRFPGSPSYMRLRSLAQGIAAAFADSGSAPLLLLIDSDVGRLLGQLLDQEFHINRKLVCVDGVELNNFDYVDVGSRIPLAQVVPVVVKSLIFGR